MLEMLLSLQRQSVRFNSIWIFLHAPFPHIAHTEVELILAKASDQSFSDGLICSSFSQIIFRQEREDVLDESNLT